MSTLHFPFFFFFLSTCGNVGVVRYGGFPRIAKYSNSSNQQCLIEPEADIDYLQQDLRSTFWEYNFISACLARKGIPLGSYKAVTIVHGYPRRSCFCWVWWLWLFSAAVSCKKQTIDTRGHHSKLKSQLHLLIHNSNISVGGSFIWSYLNLE